MTNAEIFQINTELDIPIYQQLADAIGAAVKKGELVTGQQLPTVQELSQQLGIARGTIKRAYDELERQNLLKKAPGRGTFVWYQPVNSESRKEQAMASIESLLSQLEGMGFSIGEISIFLNLKLREREAQEAYIKVAVVECNPENLAQMAEQLRHIPHVDLYSHLLDSVQQYPYKLGDDLDLIVTTASHADYLQSILPTPRRIAPVALRMSTSSLSSIIRMKPGTEVGFLGYSQRFADLLRKACRDYAEDVITDAPLMFGPDMDVNSYLAGKDVILVPVDYNKYCNTATAESLRLFKGQLVECSYKLDEGSLLYLETKIQRMLEEKSI